MMVAAALDLAAEQGWRRLRLAEIAARAGLALHEIRPHFACKTALLAAAIAEIDRRVLERETAFETDDTPHDRLFEVLMRRFDALVPHRDAVAAILRDLPGDPLSLLLVAPGALASMGWMLEAAGLSAGGVMGALRAKGLAVVWLATLRVWLRDDTSDLARTMAALDRNLRRAGCAASLLDRAPKAPLSAEESPA
jgi:AcrR family transcriptional regulator